MAATALSHPTVHSYIFPAQVEMGGMEKRKGERKSHRSAWETINQYDWRCHFQESWINFFYLACFGVAWNPFFAYKRCELFNFQFILSLKKLNAGFYLPKKEPLINVLVKLYTATVFLSRAPAFNTDTRTAFQGVNQDVWNPNMEIQAPWWFEQ